FLFSLQADFPLPYDSSSNRCTSELNSEGGRTQNWDYEPYGKAVAGVPPRKGFIDREKDKESNLSDFGVRKYDDEIGRFTSPDPLWEEYRGWSPYQYLLNNPILLIDPDGRDAIVTIKGNTITVSSKIYIYESGASASTVSITTSESATDSPYSTRKSSRT
ncbi:MAG: RHS repeat-associated core domain-containing protein, partial [Chlorobi bacterium]|nr:RHS repeat-associated core domain-containing protein [Chlorobiota bacterium]